MDRKRIVVGTVSVWVLLIVGPLATRSGLAQDNLLARIGPGPGICVLLGESFADTAVQLARNGGWTVYVQAPQVDQVLAVRRSAEAAGLLGIRIYADQGDWSRLHLADNLADVVVTDVAARTESIEREVMRIVRPRGRWIRGEQLVVKPAPEGSGQWTHPYHGPDNNPQADDALAVAPYRTQFLATPWYGPMPEVTVSSGGRLFKAFGHLAFKQREWPMLSKLIAMNAYNGTKLWQIDLQPGFMIHRNTIVAMPDVLYLADDQSCKLIDAATGRLLDQIQFPAGFAEGTSWKWMAIERGVMYALLGPQEQLHEIVRGERTQTGWPWTSVRETYGPHQDTWGYGRTMLAMDPVTKRVLWSRHEAEPIDSRAVCMNEDRIFLYAHQRYLAAIDAKTGATLWRTSDPVLLAALGDHYRAQDARYGYATSAYAKCNADTILFAGPQRTQLVAVSARNGGLLWARDDGNMQLVLREDGLYAMGRLTPSRKLDYLTGEVLAELDCFRGNCTRATGAADSIFARGYRHSGTLRLNLVDGAPYRIPAMRPACQDGVIVANGLLYWGPWMCDCNHSLIGVVSLGPASDSDLQYHVDDGQRLESFVAGMRAKAVGSVSGSEPATCDAKDWPTYRASNSRTGATPVVVPQAAQLLWEQRPAWASAVDCSDGPDGLPLQSTAAIAVGERVFFSGADGIVWAVHAATGDLLWKAYTGGAVQYSPSYDNGRLYVGSADGWIYCHEADTGHPLWRFRAAPVQRKIPAYGRLSSTWPVTSGVLVQDGTAFAAAGIASHDGTHVYALDAMTGDLKWHNDRSGSLTRQGAVVGVSTQGHLLYHNDKLYLAAGNVISPAVYDPQNGRCLSVLDQQPSVTLDDHWQQQRSPRGSELLLVGDQVLAGGPMMYSPTPDGPPSRYHANDFLQAQAGDVIIRAVDGQIVRLNPLSIEDANGTPVWKNDRFQRIDAIALAENAVIVGGLLRGESEDGVPIPALGMVDIEAGRLIRTVALPARPTPSGISLDRNGRMLVSLACGSVQCWGTVE